MKSNQATSGRRGFTILELMITLALITLVAALAIPAFYSRPEVTLENATRLLLRDLRAAQNRAARLQSEVRFHLLAEGRGYRVVLPDDRPLPDPLRPGPFERDYGRDAVFEGVRITRADLGPDDAIRFGPYGFSDEGGVLELTYGGASCRVEVEPLTGRLRVSGLSEPFVDEGR